MLISYTMEIASFYHTICVCGDIRQKKSFRRLLSNTALDADLVGWCKFTIAKSILVVTIKFH